MVQRGVEKRPTEKRTEREHRRVLPAVARHPATPSRGMRRDCGEDKNLVPRAPRARIDAISPPLQLYIFARRVMRDPQVLSIAALARQIFNPAQTHVVCSLFRVNN